MEEWDLWISAAERGWRFHRLPQVTFEYRVRPGSLLSMVDNEEFLDQLLESVMTKHYELYQPRLVKQLAKMKRSAAYLTVSVRRLSEENDSLRRELLAAKHRNEQIGGLKNSRGWRLLTYVRRTRRKAPQLLTLWKNRFRKNANEE